MTKHLIGFSLVTFLASAFALAYLPAVADAAYTFSGPSAATTTSGAATLISGLELVAPAASTTPMRLFVSNGTLSFGTTTGLTFTGASSGSNLSFSGTVANINAALATLMYTRSGTGTDTLEASIAGAGEVLFPDNGHIYKYISGYISASAARTAAASQTAGGVSGYLATITTQAENDYISARLQGDGWFGASDEGSEGVWKWVTGPEAGETFWNGQSAGTLVSGYFENWASGEPNDYGSGEDCAQFYSNGSGWNDLPCTGNTLPGYVVEFGAPGALPESASKNVSLSTVAAPALSSRSPADNATGVALSANLSMTFNMSVATSTGAVVIKKSEDGSVFESIDIAGSRVSKSGDTITIDPSGTFDEGTSYYVNVASTTVQATGNSLFYAGITDSTSWNFTTLDVTAPVISSVSGSSTSSTTAAFTWTTNENASSRISYGLTSARGTNTSETDTSPRVRAHARTLSGLLACTTYHYAVVSTDGFSNTATSTTGSFTTTGCQASEIPATGTSTAMTSSVGGTVNLAREKAAITVTAPANVTSTSSSLVIQIQALASQPVLSSIGHPNSAANKVGDIVFDVKAIIDGGTVLDSFDHPVTIEYVYDDSDIEGLDESTLLLYHYRGGSWAALDACSVDTGANRISCTAPHFSIFSLFGEVQRQSSGSSGGASIRGRVANLAAMGNIEAAEALKREWSHLFAQAPAPAAQASAPAAASAASVRDLTVGMSGEDVRMLQTLLIGKGYAIPAGATGYFASQTKAALSAYQKDFGVKPSVGYFGSITRAQMKAAGIAGLWW